MKARDAIRKLCGSKGTRELTTIAVEDGNVLGQGGSPTRWRKPNKEGLVNWNELEEDALI